MSRKITLESESASDLIALFALCGAQHILKSLVNEAARQISCRKAFGSKTNKPRQAAVSLNQS
jgi:hypothetical protein